MNDELNLSFQEAVELDQQDPLALFRQRFVATDPGLIYLDGNSLGRLPAETTLRLEEVIENEWGKRLIRSWNEGWYELPERVGEKMARVVGAQSDEVIMADATSVNLFKLALAALETCPGRTKIVTDDLNFPSDLYILQGVCRLAGPDYDVHVVKSADGIHGPVDGLLEAIDEQTALLALSHTAFKSGYTYDIANLTQAAHQAGALVLWDCSHSVGALPIELSQIEVDLAIGCSYKYVNGGPGSPAFLYVRQDHQDEMNNPISGWMGQENPFEFGLQYKPISGLRRFLTGTPPILQLAAAEIGLDLLLEAGIKRIRKKSVRQSEYFIKLVDGLLTPNGYRLKSPRDPARRGSHVTLGHDEGYRIDRVLIEQLNVLPDFRPPDNIRIGIAPLYNNYTELHQAVFHLKNIVDERLYEHYPTEELPVT